jgi:hypothetical protein
MQVIAEHWLDRASSAEKIRARLYEPVLEDDGITWSCRVEVDGRVDGPQKSYGGSSLQALELGVKLLSIILYASPIYRRKALGFHGRFGGDLGIPAMSAFFDEAPYPF